nr:AtpF [Desmotetra delicata]
MESFIFHFPQFFPIGHGGFGINTNILETNIINLAAVVGIVVSFVGSNLNSLLEDRKTTILKNLQEANQRAIEAQEKLNQARAQLEQAKKKAQEIREEGILRATQEINNCVTQHELRLARLEEFKQETVQFYQQKALKQAYMYVISKIMTRVRERLNTGLDSTYHVFVNNFYVSRFTEYNSK